MLLRDGVEQPLIPRYFDLLVFLIQHRHEAVHRRDIFDGVWRDVIVSDSALSQAIRTIRRTLGDDSREPRFIRTVSRHGYRFVFDEIIEEPDEDGWPAAGGPPSPEPESTVEEPFEPLLERLTRTPDGAAGEEDQREAAELLHALGTAEALARLGTRSGHTLARAILRDTRWEVPTAGPVPLRGAPGGATAAVQLVRIRLRRAARIVASRWAAASAGAGAAGALAGAAGGVLLSVIPGGTAPLALAPVLALGCTRLTFTLNDKPNAAAVHDLGLAAASLTFEATARGIFVHQMIGILPDRAREVYAIPANVQPLTGLRPPSVLSHPVLSGWWMPNALHP